MKRGRREFVPGEVLVRFKHNKAFQGSVWLAVPDNRRGAQTVGPPTEQVQIRLDRFEGSDLVDGLRLAHASQSDTWKAIAALKAREDVLYAEPNYIVHADNTPNDPLFNQLYGMTKIAAPQAWDINTGSSNIVVGVVDEGIQLDHPDLQANIWTNPSPGSIPGITGDLHGYDFVNNSGTIPVEGHGTLVAGPIGAVGNNGIGVVGVNWQSSLMSLRFLDSFTGQGSDADAIRAFSYAKQMHDLWISSGGTSGANVRVLNNSWGGITVNTWSGSPFLQATLDAINSLSQSDILFVAAAGNYPQQQPINNDQGPLYPASYNTPNMIAVASTDSNDNLSSDSHYGPRSVLMSAPGVGVLSTYPPSNYLSSSGTSLAAPHVAGAAALLLAANPNLSVNQLRALLAYNGDVLPALLGKTVTGRRLNVFRSLQAVAENDTIPPGTVGNFMITSQSGRTFNLSWVASGDDGAVGQASLYDLSFIDQTSGAVLPLVSVIPASLGSLQTVSVNIPFRHPAGTLRLREFDNVGNEGVPANLQISIPLDVADPYLSNLSCPVPLSTGGTGLAFDCDDCFKTMTLPFAFPFFGQNYTSVKVSSNGNIYFEPPTAPTRGNGDADDVPGLVSGLAQFKMIAGMWDDLDLRTCSRADADVYVVQLTGRTIFRWQGVPFTTSTCPSTPLSDPNSFINFEIELNSDGTIKTRYGGGNINLFPVVGISGGEPDVYVIDALTSTDSPITLTNAQSAVFNPRSVVVNPMPLIQFSLGNYDVSEGVGSATIAVTRSWNTTGTSTVSYATSDGSALQSRDYLIETGTLTFNPGDTIKMFTIPIVDDAFPEPTETLTVSLSGVGGATLGCTNTATVTISDNDQFGPSVHVNGQLVPPKRFMAALEGLQETPPTCMPPPAVCPRSGSGMVLLNSNETSALVGLQIFNLGSAESAAHIHTGAVNVPGPITFPLPTANPVTDFTIMPTAQQVADLKAGQQYMNVHSSNFPSGEIRGQLLWNPTLEMPFFIRQHYLDFLNREPDTGGLLFWLSQINCPPPAPGNPPYDQANVPCFHDRTVGVSDQFFFSGEFHLTASFVFKAYRAAYGNTQPFPNPDPGAEAQKLPDYNVFMSDRPRVLGGANLEQAQLAFTSLFVSRPEFTSRYGAGLNTGALFVDAVLANIQTADGVVFSSTDRQTLIDHYNNAGGGNAGRAKVMWHLSNDYWNTCPGAAPCVPAGFGSAVDNRAYIDAEYNREFALTLYFGYLRRNPEIGGFLFWQDAINQAPVRDMNRQIALVCSFVTSGEYQARFGPFPTSGNSFLFPRSNAECR